MSEESTLEPLAKLEQLLVATRKLRAALRKAEAHEILEAVGEQADAVRVMEADPGVFQTCLTSGPGVATMREILELNEHNRRLSANGLHVLAVALREIPAQAYSADGRAQMVPVGERISESA